MGLKLLRRDPLKWHHLLPNFIKIYQAVPKLLVQETQTHTDRLVIS
jgi:hypothetical protein